MASALTNYIEARERLKKGQPLVVTKGTKIANDAVSLEAEFQDELVHAGGSGRMSWAWPSA